MSCIAEGIGRGDTRKIIGYWNCFKNQRDFLNTFARKYDIKQPSDWGRITKKQISKEGGRSLLLKFGDSPRKLLRSVFAEHTFPISWFSNLSLTPKHDKYHWSTKSNQKLFLTQFAKERGIEKPEDWGKVTFRELSRAGARGILVRYGDSPKKMLQANFPEVIWKTEWFKHVPPHPASYWESKENSKHFLESLASEYHLIEPQHWQKLTISLFKNKGGAGLLKKYGNSLLNVLKNIYPEIDWQRKMNHSVPEYDLENSVKLFFLSDGKEAQVKAN